VKLKLDPYKLAKKLHDIGCSRPHGFGECPEEHGTASASRVRQAKELIRWIEQGGK